MRLDQYKTGPSELNLIATAIRNINTTKIVFGTREFNIRSILNLEEKNRFLKIEAEEHTAISA